MPTYRVTDNETGSTFDLTGDSPPNEAELQDIFASQKKEFSPSQYFKQGVGSFIRGVGEAAASIPEAIAIPAATLERKFGELGWGNKGVVEEQGTYKFGQGIREAAQTLSPEPVKGLEESFWSTQVPMGAGSTLPMIAGGVAGKLAKIPALAVPALMGAAQGASSGYEDANLKGASEDQKAASAALNAVVGLSEAAPLGRILHRLDGIAGGTIKKAMIDAGKEGFEEALQEAFQSGAGDVIAKWFVKYDPDRKMFQQVVDNAEAGGVVGTVMSLMSSAIGHKINTSRAKAAGFTDLKELEAAQQQWADVMAAVNDVTPQTTVERAQQRGRTVAGTRLRDVRAEPEAAIDAQNAAAAAAAPQGRVGGFRNLREVRAEPQTAAQFEEGLIRQARDLGIAADFDQKIVAPRGQEFEKFATRASAIEATQAAIKAAQAPVVPQEPGAVAPFVAPEAQIVPETAPVVPQPAPYDASKPEALKTETEKQIDAVNNLLAKVKTPVPEAKPKELPKSSTQLTLSPVDAQPFKQFAASIPDSEVYHKADKNGKEDYGVETDPHITVLYGLTKHEAGPVARAVEGHGPVTVKLGKLSVFENPEYDVLKVEVISPSIRSLNKKVKALPNENSFPDYTPHLTIAYLKKGEGKKYVGDKRFAGQTLTFPSVTFSPPSELREKLGRPELSLTVKQEEQAAARVQREAAGEVKKFVIKHAPEMQWFKPETFIYDEGLEKTDSGLGNNIKAKFEQNAILQSAIRTAIFKVGLNPDDPKLDYRIVLQKLQELVSETQNSQLAAEPQASNRDLEPGTLESALSDFPPQEPAAPPPAAAPAAASDFDPWKIKVLKSVNFALTNGRMPLVSFIDAPELFKKYPALTGTFLEVRPADHKVGGWWQMDDKTIVVAPQHEVPFFRVLLHEIQHAVDTIEGRPVSEVNAQAIVEKYREGRSETLTQSLPKLAAGEKGTGDLLKTQTEDFALVGERGVDPAAQQQAAAAAAQASAEAQRLQDERQQPLFSLQGRPEIRLVRFYELPKEVQVKLPGHEYMTPKEWVAFAGEQFRGSADETLARAEALAKINERGNQPQLALGQSGGGVESTDVELFIQKWLGDYPQGLVHVVQSETDLPPLLRQKIGVKQAGLDNPLVSGVSGVAWNGQVYIVADKLPTLQESKRVLFEEITHIGFEWDEAFLEAVLARYEGTKLRKDIEALYTKSGIPEDQQERIEVAKEIIGKLGREEISDPTLWQQFLAWFTRLLRRLGLRRSVGESEIRAALARSRENVRQGRAVPREQPEFAYTDPENVAAAKRLTENATADEQEHARMLATMSSQATMAQALDSWGRQSKAVQDLLPEMGQRAAILSELNQWWSSADTRPISEQVFERAGGDPRIVRSVMGAIVNNFERWRQKGIEVNDALGETAKGISKILPRFALFDAMTMRPILRQGFAQNILRTAKNALDTKIEAETDPATKASLSKLRLMITASLDGDMVGEVLNRISRLDATQREALVRDIQAPTATVAEIRSKWDVLNGLNDELANYALGALRLNRELGPKLQAAQEATTPQALAQIEALRQPDIEGFAREYERLRAISPTWRRIVGALGQDLAQTMKVYQNQDTASKWVQGVMTTPWFQRNWTDATKALGVNTIAHKDDGLELTYKDPNESDQAKAPEVTIKMYPLTKTEWQQQQRNVQTASEWMLEYIQNGQDPVLRETYQAQLDFLNAVLCGSTGNPETGRITPGTMDVFGMIRQILDVPEVAGRFLGGTARAEVNRALKNYSESRHFAANQLWNHVHEIGQRVKAAALVHKMTPLQWLATINKPILRNERAVGDRHYRLGSSLPGGHVVRAEDLTAVRAQVKLFRAMAGGVANLSTQFPGFRLSPSKIRRKDLPERRVLLTDAIGGTEFMLPSSFSNAGETLAKDWMETVRKTSGDDQIEALSQMVDNPTYYPILLTYFSTFSDPSFPVESPLRDSALKVQRDMELGDVPASFDEWIERLQQKEEQRNPPVMMSSEAVREQVLKDLTSTMARVESALSEDVSTAKDDAMLDVLDAKNFMNRPRGDTIGLKGMYDVGLGTLEEQIGLMTHVTQVYGQELLNKWRSVERQLSEYRRELEGKVQTLGDRGAVNEETRLARDRGEAWYALQELDTLLNGLRGRITEFGKMGDQGKQIINQMIIPRGIRAVRSFMIRNLLQGVNTLTNNWLGGMAKMNDMDIAFGYNPKGTIRNTKNMAKNLFNVVVDMMSDYALGTPEAAGPVKQLLDKLRRNPGPFTSYLEQIVSGMEKRQVRFAKMQELGLINVEPFQEQLKARWALRNEGGSIRGQYPTKTLQNIDRMLNAWEAFWDIGSLGGRLTAIADAAVNVTAFDKTREFVGDLQLNILKAYRAHVAAGEHPDTIKLSPQEIFGSRLATPQSLQYLRIWFEENGMNFDQMAREYYQKFEAASPSEREYLWLMDKYGLNGLSQTVANQVNRAAYSNRPQAFAGSSYGRVLLTFLGYGANENAQASLLYGKPTIGAKRAKGKVFGRKVDFSTQELHTFFNMFMTSLFGKLVLGTLIAAPLISFLSYQLYKKRRSYKALSDVENTKDLLEVLGTSTGPFLPLAGQAANNALQPGTPGRGFLNTGFQLAPLSFLDSVFKSLRQARETGSFTRPALSFLTQYMPMSQAVINRMPMMEGVAAVQSDVAAQRAHTPSSIEMRKQSPANDVHYSPAWSQIQDLKNEIGKTEQNVERQQAIRQEGIEKYREKGNPQPEKAFDRALLASSNKMLTVYGRELTPEEKAKVDKNKSPEERAESDRIDQNIQAFAARNGDPVPDFVRTRARTSGTASASSGSGAISTGGGIGRPVALGGVGATRRVSRGGFGRRTRVRGSSGLRRVSLRGARGFRAPKARRYGRNSGLRAVRA